MRSSRTLNRASKTCSIAVVVGAFVLAASKYFSSDIIPEKERRIAGMTGNDLAQKLKKFSYAKQGERTFQVKGRLTEDYNGNPSSSSNLHDTELNNDKRIASVTGNDLAGKLKSYSYSSHGERTYHVEGRFHEDDDDNASSESTDVEYKEWKGDDMQNNK
jgi:hypothetical protein